MDDVSIPLPADVIELLVERTTARLAASAFVAEPSVGVDAASQRVRLPRVRRAALEDRRHLRRDSWLPGTVSKKDASHTRASTVAEDLRTPRLQGPAHLRPLRRGATCTPVRSGSPEPARRT
jgi:hypothetical protein